MRPADLKTQIFLDSGDPEETRSAYALLGFLDGQTTNPSLIATSPTTKEKIGDRTLTTDDLLSLYKDIVQEIAEVIPDGKISIEVYADSKTTPVEMIAQAREMCAWTPNAYVKLPTNAAGLAAAETLAKEGIRLNMTLCFSQEQAAAVYAATSGAAHHDIFVSPFAGRLDDIGQNGMELIKNIITMYGAGDGHVAVLAASIRNLGHLQRALQIGSDIVTVPIKIIRAWQEQGASGPDDSFVYTPDLTPMAYKELDLSKTWRNFNTEHPLTDKGIEQFSTDWNTLITE